MKVCDFGTVSEQKTVMTASCGTYAWMAPEVMRSSNYNEKCDVYSFAIILWEMITRRKPFQDIELPQILFRVGQNGARPQLISKCPEPLMRLITRCWGEIPDERPSMMEVFQILDAFKKIFKNGESAIVDTTPVSAQTISDQLQSFSYLQVQKLQNTLSPPGPPLVPTRSASYKSLEQISSRTSEISPGRIVHTRHRSADSSNEQRPEPSHNNLVDTPVISFSLFKQIDPKLWPITPTPNQKYEKALYYLQITACRDLYETEELLRRAIRRKHILISQLMQFEELNQRQNRLAYLQSIREECLRRIADQ